ncbi:RloB family protein [Aeromonas caviae]|uniref:RloB family protein n=1 Tax=Aeromonas caviae TaxID=648 RepID=UPI002B478A97|nr:RloB family protein [Aeromonas caviae]
MAIDNSPKIRQRKQLERKKSRRASHDRILIVSEGSQTEPNYFLEIRQKYRLHTANVAVQYCELGTAPLQVVTYAQRLFEKGDEKKDILPRAFERVYAVFDRDEHLTYFDALGKAQSLDKKLRNDNKSPVIFKAIPSIPSFELWLLLHYEDIKAPIHRDEVMRRLKKHIPNYKKGNVGAFATTSFNLATATIRANELAKRHTAYDDPNPFTAISELVSLLIDLQKP